MLPLLTARPWIRATRPTRHATCGPLDFDRWGCGGGGLQLHLPYARRCRHGHLNLVSHHRHSVEDRAPPACSSLGSPRCGAVRHRRSIALWDLLFLQILLVCSSPMILVRCRGCASGRSLCGWPRCPLQIAGVREEVLYMACCSSWCHSSAARFVQKSGVLFLLL